MPYTMSPVFSLVLGWGLMMMYDSGFLWCPSQAETKYRFYVNLKISNKPVKLEPQGALIAHLSTMSTSVIS